MARPLRPGKVQAYRPRYAWETAKRQKLRIAQFEDLDRQPGFEALADEMLTAELFAMAPAVRRNAD